MPELKTAFIAYRHTGEDPAVLEPMLVGVRNEFRRLGIDAYCTFFAEEEFQDNSMGPRAIMAHAFETIQSRDIVFVILANNAKSEGMIMEVGRFFGIIPIIMAVRDGLRYTYLPDMADRTYIWNDQNSLIDGIAPALANLA